MKKEVRDCFVFAKKDEDKGKKHKGLLIAKPDNKIAEEYISKAKINLQLCDLYKSKGYDYKIPEDMIFQLRDYLLKWGLIVQRPYRDSSFKDQDPLLRRYGIPDSIQFI